MGSGCFLSLFLSLSLPLSASLPAQRLDPCSIMMTLRTKTCSVCNGKRRQKHYHAPQWNKEETEQATCRQCSTHLECSACGKRLSKEGYRPHDWSSKSDEHPCAECYAKTPRKSKLALAKKKKDNATAEGASLEKVPETMHTATPAVNETTNEVESLLMKLGFGKCKLCGSYFYIESNPFLLLKL